MVDTIHDGHLVPAELGTEPPAAAYLGSDGFLVEEFGRERDWGANLFAEELAHRLGVVEYHRVPTARCVVDLGRNPGFTAHGADHMSRLAISAELAERLTNVEVSLILARFYEPLWYALISRIKQRGNFDDGGARNAPLVRIAVHTFDRFGHDGQRPSMSVLTAAKRFTRAGETREGEPAESVFASTADSLLVSCFLSACSRAGIDCTENHPYFLPGGSVEIRLNKIFGTRCKSKYAASFRPFSTVALEVRKDLLCEYGQDGEPLRLRVKRAAEIAKVVASGVEDYFELWRETVG